MKIVLQSQPASVLRAQASGVCGGSKQGGGSPSINLIADQLNQGRISGRDQDSYL